jgi:hypothetical protein
LKTKVSARPPRALPSKVRPPAIDGFFMPEKTDDVTKAMYAERRAKIATRIASYAPAG